MKILHLVVILSAGFYCDCKLDEDLLIIFSNKDNYISIVKSDALYDVETLAMAVGPISSLAVYEDDLYVSVHCGQLWRINTYDLWLPEEPRDASWKKLEVPRKDDIVKLVSMAVIEGYIYLGYESGSLQRCKVKAPSDCEDFYNHKEDIVGIGFNPGDGKMYALSKSGTLLRCTLESTSEPCKEIYSFDKNKEVRGFKVAFNAAWLGVNGNELWKCPLESDHGMECKIFYRNSFCKAKIVSIGASEKYLYVNADGAKELRRCDPEDSRDCIRAMTKPDDGLDQFVLGYETNVYSVPKGHEYF